MEHKRSAYSQKDYTWVIKPSNLKQHTKDLRPNHIANKLTAVKYQTDCQRGIKKSPLQLNATGFVVKHISY